jgi:transcriptional regulator with XRE-family HTH domain
MRKLDAHKARKALGKTIRAYRVSMGISQEKLAELADVHRNYIGKIERGEQNITINSLCQLATVFEKPLSEIMGDAGL